tara:strand:+ start:5270 stop:6349 length:1080 start_codon:yes stop_codon:yes gene_type:complete
MSLVKNYLSLLKTNNFALDDINSKNIFLDYCINTNTASFFLDRASEEFRTAMESHDFRESILFSKKKSLQHQTSLKSFLKLAKNYDIDVCLLKGAYMSNFMYQDFSMRSMRDIDILVDEGDFLKIVNVLLENGYFFLNSNERKLTKFNFNYAHQAPILVDRFGVAVEIHHRLKTYPEINNSDYLSKHLIKNKKEKTLFDLPVSIPDNNFAFIHCCYHAINKSKLNIGPIFLNDLMEFKDQINDKIFEDAKKSNCLKETELGIEISNYLHDLSVPNKKQVEEAIEIILLCYKMPEFMPRKKLNLLSSLKKSYAFNSYAFSLRDLSTYVTLKTKQIVIFLKSYLFNFSLHKKRSRFFKDFK